MFVEKHYKSYKRYQYNDDYTYYFVVIDNRGNPTFLQPRDLHPRFVIKHKLRLICLIYTADNILDTAGSCCTANRVNTNGVTCRDDLGSGCQAAVALAQLMRSLDKEVRLSRSAPPQHTASCLAHCRSAGRALLSADRVVCVARLSLYCAAVRTVFVGLLCVHCLRFCLVLRESLRFCLHYYLSQLLGKYI